LAAAPAPAAAGASTAVGASIVGVGTAVSGTAYSQAELLDLLDITDQRIRSVFLNSAIERRYLTIPPAAAGQPPTAESQGDLLRKHRAMGTEMGSSAVRACLADAGLAVEDIDYLCCVTTTGFLTPGLSALLISELGLSDTCARLDVVGMGCNAGLNALNAVASWATANPGKVAILACIEACSAAYVVDATMRTAVVNSLFGDGAAAIAVVGQPRPGAGPQLLDFASRIIPEAIGAMRYDWDEAQGKYSFYLDPKIPYVVGSAAEEVIDRLLTNNGLRRRDIDHWIIHSGGKKVIDAMMINLGLDRHDVRHTSSVLRDYGNVSSASFLFSYQRLRSEARTAPGDWGVLVTMGPGSTIESALLQF
jgi:polyketide synthase Type III